MCRFVLIFFFSATTITATASDTRLNENEDLRQHIIADDNRRRADADTKKAVLKEKLCHANMANRRIKIAGLTVNGILLALIVIIIVWNRRKISRKNRGLYRQIKEQDALRQELKRLNRIIINLKYLKYEKTD
jgi:hypothetical protein